MDWFPKKTKKVPMKVCTFCHDMILIYLTNLIVLTNWKKRVKLKLESHLNNSN